ncbi:MAG: ThuA domain-containing protein [Pirellulales bacterium]|nr:ThuA domain-containing protein [Pirellulales bacterium]
MQRREFVRAAGAALSLSAFPWGWTAAQDQPKKKVLFFTRSAGFEHSAIRREGDQLGYAEKRLTELGEKHGFEVTCSKDGRLFDGDIDQYGAFVFYTTEDLTNGETGDKQPAMSAAGKQKLLDAVKAGKGFCATHSGADTFHSPGHHQHRFEAQTERDPYINMLGGEFISHGPQQESRQVVASATFPGLADAGDSFMLMDEWYSLKNYADDLHVILVQDTQGMKGGEYNRPPYPSTWARKHGEGRVFYTSMGHREDVWDNPLFQQILLGGLAWALRNVDFDPTPNMAMAAPGAGVMPKPR